MRPAVARWALATVLCSGLLAGGLWRLSSSESPLPVESRTRDCAICRKMTESLPAGEFDRDAHGFFCRTCHHPHTQKTAEEWRFTCTSSGCHPRAWTESVFHRLDANVFVKCTNCHGVHVWTVEGTNCRDCHGAFADSSRSLAVTGVSGVKTFNHAPHRNLDCAICHRSETRHAELAIHSAADCSSCHHEARRDTPCETCHAKRELAFSRVTPLSLALSVWDGPRSRNVPFDHARHATLACASCHEKGGQAARADCASCHEAHHAPDADCARCHGTPPPGAHEAEVHEAECTDCHAKGPRRAQPDTRSLCLSCHRDQIDHNPGQVCANCHKVTAGS